MALGELLSGRWAAGPDEVALSQAVCEALNAQLGDRVEVGDGDGASRTVLVTGILVNAADLADRLVIGVQPGLEPEDVTMWLTDGNPYAYPALVDPMDRTAIKVRSVASLAEDRASDLPGAATSIRMLPGGLAVLVGTLLLAALAGFFPSAVLDARSLQAAGLSPRASWRPILRTAAGAVLAGEAVGSTVAIAVLRAGRDPLGERFNQAWLSVPTPVTAIVATFVITGLFFVVIGPSARGFSRMVTLSGRQPRAVAGRAWSRAVAVAWLAVVSATAALLAALLKRDTPLPERLHAWVPCAAAVAGTAIAVAFVGVVGAGLGQASRALLLAMARSMAPVAAGVAVVASIAGTYVSTAVHGSYVAQAWGGAGHESEGALYVSGVPGPASAEVREQYRSIGGRHVVQYLEPDESLVHSRVSTTGLLHCLTAGHYRSLDDMPVTCYPQLPTSSMTFVLLSPDRDAPVEADRHLVVDGQVAILKFKTMSSLILRTAELSARSNPALGDRFLPGLVVPVDGEVAREYGLIPSGTEFLALTDFASLAPIDQSRIRGTLARLAPTAYLQDTTDGDVYGRQRSIARGVALAAAALAFLVMLVGGIASYLGSRRALDALHTLSAGRRYRLGLLARLFAAPTLTLVASPALVALGNAVLDGGEGASYGVAWLFPTAGGLAGLGAVILVWLRVPRAEPE